MKLAVLLSLVGTCSEGAEPLSILMVHRAGGSDPAVARLLAEAASNTSQTTG
jgi:hypothetical protein